MTAAPSPSTDSRQFTDIPFNWDRIFELDQTPSSVETTLSEIISSTLVLIGVVAILIAIAVAICWRRPYVATFIHLAATACIAFGMYPGIHNELEADHRIADRAASAAADVYDTYFPGGKVVGSVEHDQYGRTLTFDAVDARHVPYSCVLRAPADDTANLDCLVRTAHQGSER